MSLTLNSKHFNTPEIARLFSTSNGDISNDYRFFGVKQKKDNGQNNPCVILMINFDYISDDLGNNWDEIRSKLELFFRLNNLSYDIIESDNVENICIGFRRDLRENIKFSGCLLETIIYATDGKLKLSNKSIIPNCPKFD